MGTNFNDYLKEQLRLIVENYEVSGFAFDMANSTSVFNTPSQLAYGRGRTFDDFQSFVELHPDYDIVEMDTHGRDIAASMKKSGVELGKRYTVTEDENNTGYVSFIGGDGIECHSMFFWLKLVTPVEEREAFGVRYSTDRDCAEVYHRRYKNTVAAFYRKCGITREQAEEHAEAECKRLNDEYRKEQNNG